MSYADFKASVCKGSLILGDCVKSIQISSAGDKAADFPTTGTPCVTTGPSPSIPSPATIPASRRRSSSPAPAMWSIRWCRGSASA